MQGFLAQKAARPLAGFGESDARCLKCASVHDCLQLHALKVAVDVKGTRVQSTRRPLAVFGARG